MSTVPPPQSVANQQSPDAIAARKDLKTRIEKELSIYNRGTIAWSSVYNSCLVGAALLSAAAAVVVKVDYWKANAADITAVCAGVAALLNTLIVGGGFDRKWRANRTARSKIKQLLVDLADPTADLPTIRTQFKKIVDDQDTAIMGHT